MPNGMPLTERRRAKRDGNSTAQLLVAPVQRRVGRHTSLSSPAGVEDLPRTIRLLVVRLTCFIDEGAVEEYCHAFRNWRK